MAFRITMALILAISPVDFAYSAENKSPMASYEISSFKFWIRESGDEVCKLGAKHYINEMYSSLSISKNPTFEWNVQGQPKGPTFQVSVEAMALSPDKCYWRVESKVASYKEEGYNPINEMILYHEFGPIRSFGSINNNTVTEDVFAQVIYFLNLWKTKSEF